VSLTNRYFVSVSEVPAPVANQFAHDPHPGFNSLFFVICLQLQNALAVDS
jgi:hypothetical protein